jgi:hypothetical protein
MGGTKPLNSPKNRPNAERHGATVFSGGEKRKSFFCNRCDRRYSNSQRRFFDAPISATAILAEIAEELVRTVLADHSDEKTISLLAISVAHLESHWDVQLELPLGLEDEKRRPGAKRGMARWTADRAVDKIRNRFGWEAVEYGSALGLSLSVPDEFRELAEKDL